jgi:hypothetical protein
MSFSDLLTRSGGVPGFDLLPIEQTMIATPETHAQSQIAKRPESDSKIVVTLLVRGAAIPT